MTAKHIDGPWTVVMPGESDNDTEFIEIDDPYGRTASVYGDSEDEEVIATANLIGSAPDLLKTLKKAVINLKDFLDPHGEFDYSDAAAQSMVRELESAIAKAERGTP